VRIFFSLINETSGNPRRAARAQYSVTVAKQGCRESLQYSISYGSSNQGSLRAKECWYVSYNIEIRFTLLDILFDTIC